MAWITCSACGSKYSDTRPGCPRCTGSAAGAGASKGGGLGWLWWTLGALVLLVLWRAGVGLAEASDTGEWTTFWSAFFYG